MLCKIHGYAEYPRERRVVFGGLDHLGRPQEITVTQEWWHDFKRSNPTKSLPLYLAVAPDGSVALATKASYDAAAAPHKRLRYVMAMHRELFG